MRSTELAPLVGDDIGLMIRAFAAALQDNQLLVQRGALDLLITALPMNSSGFRTCVPTALVGARSRRH